MPGSGRGARIRAGAALVASFLFLAALPAAVFAQRPNDQAAPQDSLGRPIFGFLRPTYSTNYVISDQQSTWDQDFKFQNNFGKFNLDSDTKYLIKTDPNRTNFRTTSGSTTNQLNYILLNAIPLSATLNYSREGTDDNSDVTRRDATDGGFNGSYKWRVRRGVEVNMNGGLGLNHRRDDADFQGMVTQVRESGTDYTVGGGLVWNNMIPGMSFHFDAGRKSATTTSETLPHDPGERPDAKNNSRDAFSGNWSYVPGDRFEATAAWSRTSLFDNYILVSRDTTLNGREETQENLSQTIGVTSRYHTSSVQGQGTELNLLLNSTIGNVDRAVEVERSNNSGSKSAELKARSLLHKTQVESDFLLQRDTDSSPIRAASETISRTLTANVTHPISHDFTANLLGEAGIRSQTYDDGLLDKDIQKLRAEGTFTWKPTTKISTVIGGRANRIATVNIDSTLSAGSQTQDNYGGTLNFTWLLTPKTTITQIYDFRLLLTTFRFNSSKDDIQRTRDIRTTLTHLLTKVVSLEVNYGYRFTETGRYRLEEDMSRVFAKSTNRYDQDMRLGLKWQAHAWLAFQTDEIFHRDDSVQLADGSKRTNTRIEFNQTASVNRPLPGNGTITCTATWRSRRITKPNLQDPQNFLNVTLALTKPF